MQRGEAESVDEVLAEGGFVREAGVSDVDSPRDAATIAELKKRFGWDQPLGSGARAGTGALDT